MKNLLNSKYPNIRVRLISGLLILLMLTSFLGILYIIDTRLLNQVTENILEHPFTVNNSVKDIGIYLNAMHRSMKDLTLAKNENELNDAILKINSYELIVYEKFDLIFERFLGRPKYVTDVYNEFIKWKPIRDRVIELVKKQKYEEAAEITKDQGAIHVDLLINKTQTMIEFANTKAIEFNNNSISILKSAYRKAILLFFIAILLWALIFVWLIRSITIPLKRIITQIKNISPDYFISKPPESINILVMLEYVVSEQKNY